MTENHFWLAHLSPKLWNNLCDFLACAGLSGHAAELQLSLPPDYVLAWWANCRVVWGDSFWDFAQQVPWGMLESPWLWQDRAGSWGACGLAMSMKFNFCWVMGEKWMEPKCVWWDLLCMTDLQWYVVWANDSGSFLAQQCSKCWHCTSFFFDALQVARWVACTTMHQKPRCNTHCKHNELQHQKTKCNTCYVSACPTCRLMVSAGICRSPASVSAYCSWPWAQPVAHWKEVASEPAEPSWSTTTQKDWHEMGKREAS